MTVKTNFYIVVDQDNNIWKRSPDFSSDNDYFDKDISQINKKNLLSNKMALSLKNELDKNVSSVNDITFTIKNITLEII